MASKKRSCRLRRERLREKRELCGLTQVELADAVGVTSRWVMTLENDTVTNGALPRVSYTLLKALAAAVQTEPEYLVLDEAQVDTNRIEADSAAGAVA
jgi:transcriptional regulator with XRE-family HTH domain